MRVGQNVLLSLLIVIVAPASAWSAIILNFAYVQSGTYENGNFRIGSLPFQDGDTAFAEGVSSIDFSTLTNKAKTAYTYRNENGIATYDVDWNFFINGEIHTEGYGYAYLEFQTTTDTLYSLSHSFTSNGGADRYHSIGFREDGPAEHYVSALGPYPFLGTPNYGNFVDIQQGSSQGVLEAGKIYYILSLLDLHAFDNVGTSDGTGHLNLTLSEIASVPEPSSFVICAIGGIAVNCLFVRRKSRTLATDPHRHSAPAS